MGVCYDILEIPLWRFWIDIMWIPIILTLLGIVLLVKVIINKKKYKKSYLETSLIGIIAIVLFMLLPACISEYQETKTIRTAYSNGEYLTVSGVVENYISYEQNFDENLHKWEEFTVNGIIFEFPHMNAYGYDPNPPEGTSVINKNGIEVVIRYVQDSVGNNIILYLEVVGQG